MSVSIASRLPCLCKPAICLSLSVRIAYVTKSHCRSFGQKPTIRWPKNYPGHNNSRSSKPNTNWREKYSDRSSISHGRSKVLTKGKFAEHLSHSDNCNDAVLHKKHNFVEESAVHDRFLQFNQPKDNNGIEGNPESDLGLSGTFIIEGDHVDRVVEDLKVSSSVRESSRLETVEPVFSSEEIVQTKQEIEEDENSISGAQGMLDLQYLGKKNTQNLQARSESTSRGNLYEVGEENEMETDAEQQDEVDATNYSSFPESDRLRSKSNEVKIFQKKVSQRSHHRKKPQIGRNHEALYGVSPCLLALKQERRNILKAFILEAFQISARSEAQEIIRLLGEKGVDVHQMSRGELNTLSQGRPHQGVCLEVSPLHFEHLSQISGELMAMPEDRPVAVLALDQILDPMNLGALMRSAYFLGVDKIVASKYKCCPLTPTVSKASSGITEVMPIYSAANMAHFLQELAGLGWLIMGATSKEVGQSTDKALPVLSCRDLQLTRPTVLVIGNEGFGLREALLAHCHQLVTIPAGRQLHPNIDSLNVSVATGIILHSLLQVLK